MQPSLRDVYDSDIDGPGDLPSKKAPMTRTTWLLGGVALMSFVLAAATLHVLVLAFFGSMVVASPIPVNLAALVAWAIVVRKWATGRARSDRHAKGNAIAIIQVTGMIALVLVAAFAPVKIVDRQKARYITLPKQVMTVAELAEPIEHGWDPFYYYSVSVPEGLSDRAVLFPARELAVGEFISTVEAQTPLRHRFSHCGNGFTILGGGDCSFGLHFRVPPATPGSPSWQTRPSRNSWHR
jgi:hypothetical protein